MNWRKTTAILLCLMLAFGQIPASAAALSDQVLDSIVGFGLGESAVEASNAESGVKAEVTEGISEDEPNTYTLQQTNEPVSDVSEPVLSSQDEALSDKPPQKDVIAEDVSAFEENEPSINDSAETDETDSEYSSIESTEEYEEYIEETTETGTQASSEEPAIIDETQQEENINQTNESETLLNETIPSDETQSPEETLTEEPKEQPEQTGDELEQEQITEEITPITEGMVLQSTAYTCGPAALATLLKMLGSDNNYYEKITQLVQIDQNGSSLLDLKRSAESLGYSAAGYRKTIEDLPASGPVVTHVIVDGYHHFTVVEGIADGYVFLADPTLGRVIVSIEQFKDIWSGVTLKVSRAEIKEPKDTSQLQSEDSVSEYIPIPEKEPLTSDEPVECDSHIDLNISEEESVDMIFGLSEVNNEANLDSPLQIFSEEQAEDLLRQNDKCNNTVKLDEQYGVEVVECPQTIELSTVELITNETSNPLPTFRITIQESIPEIQILVDTAEIENNANEYAVTDVSSNSGAFDQTKSVILSQPVLVNKLDAAQMQDIRGRVIMFVPIIAPVVIKAAIKAAPLVIAAAKPVVSKASIALWKVANTPPGAGAVGGMTHHVFSNALNRQPITAQGVVQSAIVGAVGGAVGIPFRSPAVGAIAGGVAEAIVESRIRR